METPIVVCGAAGRMGRMIVSLIPQPPGARLAAAIEMSGHTLLGKDAGEIAGVGELGVALSDDFAAAAVAGTVTLDFTNAKVALEHLQTVVDQQAAMVVGATGFTAAEQVQLDKLAPKARTVVASNMSVGIAVLQRLAADAARLLGPSFDVEIVEMHHKMKIDAPSGTALTLANAVAAATNRNVATDAVFGREGIVGARPANEIGVIALRGGDVIGDHTVIFAGMGERIELTHRAQSRDSLARGALRAALWLSGKPVGRYSMSQVLGLD